MTRFLRILGAVPGSPLRPFIVALLWITFACAVAAAALYFTELDPVWWVLAACFVGSFLISLAIIALVGRPYVRDIDTIRANPLVHWTYAADELARFEETVWQNGKREARSYPLIGTVIALVIAALVYIGSRDPLATLAVFGVFAGIGLLVTLQTWGMARWRYARRHRAHGDVYISTTGILQPRGYMPHSGFNLKLTIAEVEPGDPDMLRLQVSSFTEDALTHSSDIRIPIPYGREDEAREVAQQLLGASEARGYRPAGSFRSPLT